MAVKIFSRNDTEYSFNSIMNEVKIWETVAHDNVCKVFELFDCEDANNKIYLMMELAQFG